MPLPIFSRPPVPESTPPKEVLVLSVPVVRMKLCKVTLPPVLLPPASEPMVSLAFNNKMVPLVVARVTALVLAMAVPPETAKVPPPVMLVIPV